MSCGIDGELKDANVVYGVSIHNVRMGCGFGGEGGRGRERVHVPIRKVRNVQVHGKVTFFEFELEGLMSSLYVKWSARTYFILHTE